MSFWESVLTALFCFGMVIIVLAILYFLIKLFSLIINNIKRPNFKRIFKKKKDDKTKNSQIQQSNISNKNNPIYTTVIDEQGAKKVFRLASIKSLEEEK